MNNPFKIEKYEGIFHDGALWEIKQGPKKISLALESAEVTAECNEDNIILSKRKTITGNLILEGLKNIKEGGTLIEKFAAIPSYDRGEIFRLRIRPTSVFLLILWIKYFPEYDESSVYQYEFEAEKIYWEHAPTLFDAYWDSL